MSWPWPEDFSREDRAKRVAKSYRNLVMDIAAGRCLDPAGDLHRLDRKWIDLGVTWQLPRPDVLLDPEEWMSAADLAHAIGRTRKDIYNWARLGHVEQRVGPDGAPEYNVGSVIAYQAKRWSRRAGRRDTAVNR